MHALSRLSKELDKNRKKAVQAMLKAVDDNSLVIRVSAVEALGGMSAEGLGDEAKAVVKKLDSLLRRESNKNLLEAAKAARDKIRPPKPKG